MKKIIYCFIVPVLALILCLGGCKKEEAEKADPFEGEWLIKTKIGSSFIYLEQQSSGTYTGIGAGSSGTKIKIVKATAGKYFITINNVANKVLDAEQPVLFTFVVFTPKAVPDKNSQLFTIEPVFNSTTGYYIKSDAKHLGLSNNPAGYSTLFRTDVSNPLLYYIWELEK